MRARRTGQVQGRSLGARRSRCHHRPLNRHVGGPWRSWSSTVAGFGHSASTTATIAAASSSVGAGEMSVLRTASTLAHLARGTASLRSIACASASSRRGPVQHRIHHRRRPRGHAILHDRGAVATRSRRVCTRGRPGTAGDPPHADAGRVLTVMSWKVRFSGSTAADQSGTLPCLRCGRSSRFERNIRRPATTLRRVSAGSITSSMKPRSAATYGLAYFSV